MMAAVGRTASWALRIGCAVHLMHTSIYEFSETNGASMLPTLDCAGDCVHVNKLARHGRGCELGDMVIAAKPTQPQQRVCKRITGMPGDYVVVDPSSSASTDELIRVPPGHVWLTGDNLAQSIDSRTYGPLPQALIRGKVVAASRGFRDFRWISGAETISPQSDSATAGSAPVFTSAAASVIKADEIRSSTRPSK